MKRKLLSLLLALAIISPMLASGFGSATITAAAPLSSSVVPTGDISVESFALHKSKINLNVGKTATLSVVSVLPANADIDIPTEGVWESSDSSVVKMTGNAPGQIRALKAGTAVVSCTLDGVTASCVVTVVAPDKPVESFSLHVTTLTLQKGKTATLKPENFLPVDATNSAATKWFTNRDFIVDFTGNTDGQIRAIRAGTATITCQIGAVKAYCFVTVVDPTPEPTPEPSEAKLIEIWPEMLGEQGIVTGQYAPFALFDEYANIAYPPDAHMGYMPPIDTEEAVNLNTWRIGGSAASWVDPSVTVDLMRDVEILEIYLYDGEAYAPSFWHQYLALNAIIDDPRDPGAPYEVGGGKFYIYAGEELLVEYESTNSREWKKFVIDGGYTTDTLRFVKESGGEEYYWTNLPSGTYGYMGPFICDVNIPEVAIYGVNIGAEPTPTPTPEPEEEPDPQPSPNFGFTIGRDFVGTNGFFDMPVDVFKNMGFIREYHNWRWTEGSLGEIAGYELTANTDDPQIEFVDNWNNAFKLFYEKMKAAGVGIFPCIQRSTADGYRPNWQGDKNSTDAHSYYAHAASLFQHAARFGSNKNIDPSLIKFSAGTSYEWGLDLLEYIENWNEPNATWEPADKQFTPEQFAAMTSADYDGHMNTMGPGVGVKNADPNMKFVMGGLAGVNLTYLRAMYKWFQENRSEEKWIEANGSLDGYKMIPFEVLNVHHYATDPKKNTGITPEAEGFYDISVGLVDFRNRYFPGTEIWMSEFGYDTAQGSRQSATIEYERNGILFNEGVNVGLTGMEVQGRWLIRTYIILAAAGIDRAQQFMMRDSYFNNPEDPSVYNTCGMVGYTETNGVRGYPKKPSWYYVYTMKHWLENMAFETEVETGVDDMLAYRFIEADGSGTTATSIWLTSTVDAVAEGYELQLPEGTVSAKLVTLTDKQDFGVVSDLTVSGTGTVSIDVSEKPVFVISYLTEQEPEPEPTPFPSKRTVDAPPADATMIYENDFSAVEDGDVTASVFSPDFGFYRQSASSIVSIDPTDASAGKALKFDYTKEVEFSINNLSGLPVGQKTVVEFQFLVNDPYTVPVIMFTDGSTFWNSITVRNGDLSLRGTWGSTAVNYAAGSWHHIKVEVTPLEGGTANCSLYFDNVYITDYVAPGNSTTTNKLVTYMRTGGDALTGCTYISDVKYYRLPVEVPPTRIMLDPSMAYKAFGGYSATHVKSVPGNLCSNQDELGDPLNGNFVNISSMQPWSPTAPQVAGGVIIDLGKEYKITDLYLFDFQGTVENNPIKFYAYTGEEELDLGSDPATAYYSDLPDWDDWDEFHSYNYSLYNTWAPRAKTNVTTRYIMVAYLDGLVVCGVFPLVLYGNEVGAPPPTPSPTPDPTLSPTPTPSPIPVDKNYVFNANIANMELGTLSTETATANGFGTYGGTFTVIEVGGEKVLSVVGNPGIKSIQFNINNVPQIIEPELEYVFEFTYMVRDDYSAPSLVFNNSWVRLFNRSGNLTMNSRWSGTYAFARDVWHTMEAKFIGHEGGGYTYSLVFNGLQICSYTVPADHKDWPTITPYEIIRLMTESGSESNQSNVYYKDIGLYIAE